MPDPQRIQLRRAKGWRLPENTTKVDRSTALGNPFQVGRDGTQAQCVRLHRALMAGMYCLTCRASIEEQRKHNHAVAEALPRLRGRNLACWCPPGTPCHADTLLELANG